MSGGTVENRLVRRGVYGLLMALALGTVAGRILAVSAEHGRTPFLSANDRSRWATVRALVDHGTYAIDDVIRPAGENTSLDKDWHSIDIVFHQGNDGREHYYSSKPPLLATALAAEYWIIQRATGATLADNPFYVGRLMLLLTNGGLLALYWAIMAALLERLGHANWDRLFAFAVATLGTFLTTFAVTLNNHLPAAVFALGAFYAALPVWQQKSLAWQRFALAGFAAGLTFANELPAAALVVALGVVLARICLVRTLLAYVPAAGLVGLAMLATNYAAHRDYRPAYAMRHDGPVVGTLATELATQLEHGHVSGELVKAAQALNIVLGEGDEIWVLRSHARWSMRDRNTGLRYVVNAGPAALEVRLRENWYEFPGSYWGGDSLHGVDQGEPNVLRYAFHALVGHHGLFSLTPVWLISVAGICLALRRTGNAEFAGALFTALLSAVVLGFYLSRPPLDRNYGGVTCGLRWVFWLAPFWILAMLPALRAVAARTGLRRICYVLLAASVLSAAYAASNPWRAPWIQDYLEYQGWIDPNT